MPGFQQSYDAHKGQFELLAVATPTSDDPVGFWQRSGYTFPMVHDKDGGAKFGVQPIPHTFFIDAQGKLVDEQVGMMDAATFEAKLAGILK